MARITKELSAQYGDFQTPPELARLVVKRIMRRGGNYRRVIEPTCGVGAFIEAVLSPPDSPAEIFALEIKPEHAAVARLLKTGSGVRLTVEVGDALRFDFASGPKWRGGGRLLVIGNPPWATNSEIGSLGGANLPPKTNFKKESGLSALTGKSNFDIAEFIWLKLIDDLAGQKATIALLCKTGVARRVLENARRKKLPVRSAEIIEIDAQKWFGVGAAAALFIVELDPGATAGEVEADLFDSLESAKPSRRIGFGPAGPIADLDLYRNYSNVEGAFPVPWRQGIKHDAARVLELISRGKKLYNGLGEQVRVEPQYLYPFLKSTDIGGKKEAPERKVIVYQKRPDRPAPGPDEAPRLAKYLKEHLGRFERRKSAIYRNGGPYAIFGVGDYTFADYKVVVSGLHKQPRFLAVGPRDGRPVILDDACYQAAFDNAETAAAAAALLNDELALGFIGAISFSDAKRVLTKGLLDRIDLAELARAAGPADIRKAYLENISSIGAPGKKYPTPAAALKVIGFMAKKC